MALGAFVAGMALAATGASAGATTFSICPTGCAFATISGANASPLVHDGDELVVAPATYNDSPTLTKVLTVHGDPAGPRPVIANTVANGIGVALGPGAAGSVISHLELDATGTNGTGFQASVPGTLSDASVNSNITFRAAAGATLVDVDAAQRTFFADQAVGGGLTLRRVHITWPPGPGVALASFSGDGTLIEDSSFVSPGDIPLVINDNTPGLVTLRRVRAEGGPAAINAFGPAIVTDTLVTSTTGPALNVAQGSVQLRNVTAISSGQAGALSPSDGLRARSCGGTGCTPGSISARDVIARGLDEDVQADPLSGSSGAPGAVAIDHSDVRTQFGAVSASGGMVSDDPRFVNGSVGPGEDFHVLAGSPAIDAGVTDALTGPSDLDGSARVQGTAVDLGAYEFTPPGPAASGSGGGSGGVSSTGGPGAGLPLPGPAFPASLALRARKVQIDRRRGTGTLLAACGAAVDDQCATVGSLSATLGAGKAKLGAKRKPRRPVRAGTVTGTVPGGAQGKLTVRLSRAALAALRRRHALAATLAGTVTSRGGTTQLSGSVRLGLKPSRRKKR